MINPKEIPMTLNKLMLGMAAGCAIVMMTATSAGAGQTAQTPGQAPVAKAEPQAAKAEPHHTGMAADKAARHQAMMAEHEKMMAEMKAADQRLDDLVVKMNAASGTEKVDAIAAVVSEIVAQRQAMRGGMMKMQHGMMGQMQSGKGPMMMCPMMMKQMDVKD
jgi:regulator of PEP synthase PpsR (kinase-PPPase family)